MNTLCNLADNCWLACWHLVAEFAGSNPAEVVGFFGHLKNPPHAFLRRGSERILLLHALRHVKEPSSSVNYDVLAKFLV